MLAMALAGLNLAAELSSVTASHAGEETPARVQLVTKPFEPGLTVSLVARFVQKSAFDTVVL